MVGRDAFGVEEAGGGGAVGVGQGEEERGVGGGGIEAERAEEIEEGEGLVAVFAVGDELGPDAGAESRRGAVADADPEGRGEDVGDVAGLGAFLGGGDEEVGGEAAQGEADAPLGEGGLAVAVLPAVCAGPVGREGDDVVGVLGIAAGEGFGPGADEPCGSGTGTEAPEGAEEGGGVQDVAEVVGGVDDGDGCGGSLAGGGGEEAGEGVEDVVAGGHGRGRGNTEKGARGAPFSVAVGGRGDIRGT